MKTKFQATSAPIRKVRHLQDCLSRMTETGIIPQSSPILAGGAIRDDFMGLTNDISDYDYFIENPCKLLKEPTQKNFNTLVEKIILTAFPQADSFSQLFDTAYLTPEEQSAAGNITKGSHAHIVSVWEIEDSWQVHQLIFTSVDPIIHVNKYFDIGFCKAYCDGKKIRYTEDFLRDVKNKTMTIVGDDLTKEQVYYHADKILDKYYDFTVVVPERYQAFVSDGGFPTS